MELYSPFPVKDSSAVVAFQGNFLFTVPNFSPAEILKSYFNLQVPFHFFIPSQAIVHSHPHQFCFTGPAAAAASLVAVFLGLPGVPFCPPAGTEAFSFLLSLFPSLVSRLMG